MDEAYRQSIWGPFHFLHAGGLLRRNIGWERYEEASGGEEEVRREEGRGDRKRRRKRRRDRQRVVKIEIERLGRDIKQRKFRPKNQQQAGQIIT